MECYFYNVISSGINSLVKYVFSPPLYPMAEEKGSPHCPHRLAASNRGTLARLLVCLRVLCLTPQGWISCVPSVSRTICENAIPLLTTLSGIIREAFKLKLKQKYWKGYNHLWSLVTILFCVIKLFKWWTTWNVVKRQLLIIITESETYLGSSATLAGNHVMKK